MKLELDAAAHPAPGHAAPAGQWRLPHGAPAAGNRITARLAVTVEQHPLEGMPGWFFGDPTVNLPREARDVVEATLDAQGRIEQDIALPEEVKADTPVSAVVSASLFESGGRSVNRSLARVMWPADALVGMRPQFDDRDGAEANSSPGFNCWGGPTAGAAVRDCRLLVREHITLATATVAGIRVRPPL